MIMNKRFFQTACLLTAAVALASCGSDEELNNSAQESLQTVTLAVANTGDNFLATRAGRQLYSSEAKQDINKVKVVIYRLGDIPNGVTTNEGLTPEVLSNNSMSQYGEKTIVAQKVFSPWMKNGVSNTYSNVTNGSGRLASWTLAAADQITAEGVYMAYAVGYNDSEYAACTTFDGVAKSSSFTLPLSIAQNTAVSGDAAPKVYEVFAGSAPFVVTKKTVTEGSGSSDAYQFNVSLTLHRQVAGTIGYFTNIPVKGNADHAEKVGAKLRLVASDRSDNAVFAGFNSAYTGDASKPSTTNVKYVVNGYDNTGKTQTADAKFYGSNENNAYTVYEVTLSEWFKGTTGSPVQMDTNGDGLLNSNDEGWTNAISSDNSHPIVKKGTVLAGSFLFPFAMQNTKPTFQLQMLDSEGNIIRYWNIRLQNSGTADSQIGQKASLVGSNGTSTENSTQEDAINYSVLRNHLYSIGARNNGDGDGGSGGGDGGSGDSDDKAQDLNNETLVLRVNDNWEMIHQMDVD